MGSSPMRVTQKEDTTSVASSFFLFKRFVRFFFKMAMQRMQEELKQKEANTKRFSTFVF